MTKKVIDINTEYRDEYRFRDSEYENRLVAFIDILGFKKLIEKKGIKEILQILRFFHKGAEDGNFTKNLVNSGGIFNDNSLLKEDDYKVTIFSDLIVISYRISKKNINFCFGELISTLNNVENNLIWRGQLMRGAITYAPLYHTEEYCLGPALVKAYELESKNSIYPRVILDPEIDFSIFNNLNDLPIHYYNDEEIWGTNIFERINERLNNYKKDNTSYFIVNLYLTMICLNEIITDGFQSDSSKVIEKIRWLAAQYNSTLKLLDSTIGINLENIKTEITNDISDNFHKIKIIDY